MEFSPFGTGIEFILNWKGVNFVDWNNLVFLVCLVYLVYLVSLVSLVYLVYLK